MENKKIILIIDDSAEFLYLMRFFLESSGFGVITACEPEEGIEKAHLNPDLILLDLNMPGINGHEVCKRLKEDADVQHIPIAMLTSVIETRHKIDALNLGVIDYIGKNFPLEEILARIKAIIRETSPEKAAEVARERNKRMLEIRRILDDKDIRILYQPIVNLDSRIPIGYEALARGPRGTIFENPVNLFTLATETNMFFELDFLCRKFSARGADFLKKEDILFLNTHPSVIEQEYFKKTDFLKDSGITFSQICIEITERTFVRDFLKLSSSLEELRGKGARVAIDDVGEGYSSLNAIAELKPEFIKVDIALVRNVDTDNIKTTLMQLIIELAKKIKSRLIAEGIETENEYRQLLSLGVEYGQGFLFARPTQIQA